jgi:hypothetical protein
LTSNLKTCASVHGICSFAERVREFNFIHCIVALRTAVRVLKGAQRTDEAERFLEAVFDRTKEVARHFTPPDVLKMLGLMNALCLLHRPDAIDAVLEVALDLARQPTRTAPGELWVACVLDICQKLRVPPDSQLLGKLLEYAPR